MATTKQSKRDRLIEYLAENRPPFVTEAGWQELLRRLAPISESYLRRLLRSTGLPLAPMVGGVRQDSFLELERTLLEMEQEYSRSLREKDQARAGQCRRLVITAKDHARWVARRPNTSAEKKAQKEEMISWMMVWLESPEVFPAWVRLRRKAALPERGGPPAEDQG